MDNNNMDNNIYNVSPDIENSEQGSKAMAITSMVFGIIALITCICFCTAIPLGIVSIILAIIVFVKQKNGKPFAITGIVTSILGILVSIVTIVLYMPMFNNMMEFVQNSPAYVEEYQEDGTIPDVILEVVGNDEEAGKQFMEQWIEQYGTNSVIDTK